MLPQTGQVLSFQMCTYTPGSKHLKKKTRSLCTREWHFTTCSPQTIQRTNLGRTAPLRLCANPFRGAPRAQPSHSQGRHHKQVGQNPSAAPFVSRASREGVTNRAIYNKIVQPSTMSHLLASLSVLHLSVMWLLCVFKYSLMLFPSL